MKKLVVALSLMLLSPAAFGQAKPSTLAPSTKDLQAQVTVLEAKLAALQAEVYTLRGRLDELSTAKVKMAESAPLREAEAALKAVVSVAAGGGAYPDFKQAYLAAKVKVDALPEAADFAALRVVASELGEAHSLWGWIIRNSSTSLLASEWGRLVAAYPGIESTVGAVKPYKEKIVFVDDLKGAVGFLIRDAGQRLSVLPAAAPKE